MPWTQQWAQKKWKENTERHGVTARGLHGVGIQEQDGAAMVLGLSRSSGAGAACVGLLTGLVSEATGGGRGCEWLGYGTGESGRAMRLVRVSWCLGL